MSRIILALIMVMATASFAVADTVYLQDGRTIHGTLLGFINGRFVVRVEPRYSTLPSATADPDIARRRANEGELQYFRPAEVERIEIDGRSLDDMRFENRTVQVTLESNWIDSGIDLRRNERVQVSATGTIVVGRTRITPDGLPRTDPTAPLPNAKEGELIGAIGDDPRVPILELGSTREFVADRDGRLYLTANRASYNDARGSFAVQIRRERDLTALDNQDDRDPRDSSGRARSPHRPPLDQLYPHPPPSELT